MEPKNVRKSIAGLHKENLKMQGAVKNTEPVNWGLLKNRMVQYKRYFADKAKFWELYHEVELAFQFSTSSSLAGENRVWRYLLKSLKNESLVPSELHADMKRALYNLKDEYLALRQAQHLSELAQLSTKSNPEQASASSTRGHRISKAKKPIDIPLLQREMGKKKNTHKNGKPNWTKLGKVFHVDPDTVANRAREHNLIQ